MSRSDVQSYYKQSDQSGEQYNARRFASPGGRAVSELELRPFRQWLTSDPPQRLLDLGSGTGRVLSALPPAVRAKATAVDASPAMLDYLKATYPDVALMAGDLFTFQPEGRFDAITSLRVLDHFPLADQELLLKRFMNFLQPGGRLIISFLVGPTLESWANRMSKAGHMNYFQSRREYRQLFARCGLKVDRTFNVFVLPRGIVYRLPGVLVTPTVCLDRVVGRLAPCLCSYMTCQLTRADA